MHVSLLKHWPKLMEFLHHVINRFKIDWLRDESLQDAKTIDIAPGLSKKEKEYLKGLHERSKAGQLPKQPSQGDYKALVEA